MAHEEFTTMAQVNAELVLIREKLDARDRLDADRRKIDDARDTRMLERVDRHGTRMTAMETNWAAFFGENGAFNYVKKQLKDQGSQNKWILGLLVTTLIGVIVSLAKH